MAQEIKSGDVVYLKSDFSLKLTVGTDDGYETGNMVCYYLSNDPLEVVKKVTIHKSALILAN